MNFNPLEPSSQMMVKPAKNRRTTAAGYACGYDTRARVVASALRLFGRHGFEGASTRDIAADAGVNVPALHYYFEGKEGLYLACVAQMVSHLWAYVGNAATRCEEMLTKKVSDAAVIDCFCTVQECLADFMFSSQHPADWLLIIAREQAGLGPESGFRLVYRDVSAPLIKLNSGVIGRLLHVSATSQATQVRAMTLNGQLFMLLTLRRTLLNALQWEGFDAARVDLMKRTIRDNTEALLQRLIDTAKPQGTRAKKRVVLRQHEE